MVKSMAGRLFIKRSKPINPINCNCNINRCSNTNYLLRDTKNRLYEDGVLVQGSIKDIAANMAYYKNDKVLNALHEVAQSEVIQNIR